MINNTELTMNEQIEKIYGEACIHYGYLDEREFLEKFAQMIIRECADIALKKGMASPDTDFRTGSILLNEYLLVRYGVEE
jgi:hypothetical protein